MLNTYYEGVKREQQTYYYMLGNGATRWEATAPFLRTAIIKAFNPCIANMAVMGLVAMPGTMIGQILGGSNPALAIKYRDDDCRNHFCCFYDVFDDNSRTRHKKKF